MPARSSGRSDGHYIDQTGSDSFTRLSVPMCLGDEGTRPVNPNWPECDRNYRSPAFDFQPTYPPVAGRESTINVTVRNLGTMDATAVLLECAYNMYIDNHSGSMVPIGNQTISLIPSRGQTTVQLSWTPPDTQVVHACLHARVFDAYSLVTYPERVGTWDSFVNPQAANLNIRLIRLLRGDQPVAIPFLALNHNSTPIEVRMLVTKIDTRRRLRDVEERYPLPFAAELVTAGNSRELTTPIVSAATVARAEVPSNPAFPNNFLGDTLADHLTPTAANPLWPRSDVAERFIHQQFGFATTGISNGYARVTLEPRFLSARDFRRVQMNSYLQKKLEPDKVEELYVVIPPQHFPPRGQRDVYQVDYQVGREHPVQHILYLAY